MYLGVDIGGTHTDTILVDEGGKIWRGKAFTTYKDFSEGIINAVTEIAAQMGRPIDQVLAEVKLFINGTTVATNVVAQLKGAHVGLITTAGFEYTMFMARMPRRAGVDLHTQVALPELVPRERIVGVKERVDRHGQVLIDLDEAAVRDGIRHLVQTKGAEELVVSLLWSFVNPIHEQRIREIAAEVAPNVPVTLSSELAPVIREYERTVTSVLNGYVGPATRRYLDTLDRRTQALNLKSQLFFMTAKGGFATVEEAKKQPVFLINSGPVGGVMGAKYLGQLKGWKNVLVGDIGGTSFDVALLPNMKEKLVQRIKVDDFSTAMSSVDVTSIGAGGGSIAWIDARGALNVGPRSAGSEPGPACYGRGGIEPTTSDALVVLSLISPKRYLGGRVTINPELARAAIQERICSKIGGTIEERAADIVRIALVKMMGQVRLSTIERGYDPREFAMLIYGGLGGLFCPTIAKGERLREAIVPDSAAAFSAFGVLTVDRQVEYTVTKPWLLPDGFEEVTATFRALTERGMAALRAEGHSDQDLLVEREGDFSFIGQHSEFAMPMPGDLDAAAASDAVERFTRYYEELNGPGTAWQDTGVQMVNYRVKVSAARPKPHIMKYEKQASSADAAITERREAYILDKNQFGQFAVYDHALLHPGMRFTGPAIVEVRDTTIFVPSESEAEMDEYRNLVISFGREG